MRGRRWLLLAIAGILGGLTATYYHQKQTQASRMPSLPKPLPREVDAAASDWHWSRHIGGRPGIEVRASRFRQIQAPERIELEDVELRLYQQDGRRFDRVRCAHAIFDPSRAVLYSEGQVDIVMGFRPEAPPGRLVAIHASGVSFDSATGRVTTDRPARFSFDQGEGSAVGASYDPASRELHMRSQVELAWRGRTPQSRLMRLQSGQLVYKENESFILLFPWARLLRDQLRLEASEALVTLREGTVRDVEAKRARGSDQETGRQIQYSADQLWMTFTPHGELEKLTAEGNARLLSLSEDARITVTAGRLDLKFLPTNHTTALETVLATGQAQLLSEPRPRPGLPLLETRRMQSEVIHVFMRPGGKELERAETAAPGHIEFLPNRPEQRWRRLQAERLWIYYAGANRIRTLRAVQVTTQTQGRATTGAGGNPPPIETSSQDLQAEFDPRTGQLLRLEQWNQFRYREGQRQAVAQRAVLDEAAGRIRLENAARVWDQTSVIAADQLELDQKSDDVIAAGHVSSTHLAERKQRSSLLLSPGENLEAQADTMRTSDRRQKFLYEGHVVMWQGPNRLEAHRVEIDRRASQLRAAGNVRTQFVDKPASDGKAQQRTPILVTVESEQLIYNEQQRMAHYSGGVRLRRGELEIQAAELRAWFRESDSESTLDRAWASGQVQLLRKLPGRSQQAQAEQAEYYAGEEKVSLQGGNPILLDSLRGHTRGARLTWRMRDDTFEVEGAGNQPTLSRIRRP